jgi:glycosyltransferase involved in cell wall biosynthesis
MRYLAAGLGVLRVRLHSGGRILYVSVGGGFGLLYDTCVVVMARLLGMRIFLHHHSFHYLDRWYLPAKLMTACAGPNACHIVLGATMARALRQQYGSPKEPFGLHILSNAAFVGVPLPAAALAAGRPRRIGLLANLCREKGLDDFLELALAATPLRGRWLLAGPFTNDVDRQKCEAIVRGRKDIEWIGPVYGEAKDRFLASLDVFIFPTRYAHEAEPLVVLEAMRMGKPVIAFARGCIAEILGDSGMAVPRDADFAPVVLPRLESWFVDDGILRGESEKSRLQFAKLHASATTSLQGLIAGIGPTRLAEGASTEVPAMNAAKPQ